MENNIPSILIDELQLKLLNTGTAELGPEWTYSNIVSPFTRIYLITSGEGYIMPNNVMYKLKPGMLYIIPSFVLCNYHCVDSLSQYYIHLTNQFPTGLNIYDFLSFTHKVQAQSFDIELFKRLSEINKHSALKFSDPKTYEKEQWQSSLSTSLENKAHLETIGILKQILSRFITGPKTNAKDIQQFSNLRKVFQHINTHIDSNIKIETLAELACYSYDHFTRIFKKTTGMLPLNYINMKKIEKAQILLLTTNLTHTEICEKAGFNNLPYFYRVFQKYTGSTPATYRRMGGLV